MHRGGGERERRGVFQEFVECSIVKDADNLELLRARVIERQTDKEHDRLPLFCSSSGSSSLVTFHVPCVMQFSVSKNWSDRFLAHVC